MQAAVPYTARHRDICHDIIIHVTIFTLRLAKSGITNIQFKDI